MDDKKDNVGNNLIKTEHDVDVGLSMECSEETDDQQPVHVKVEPIENEEEDSSEEVAVDSGRLIKAEPSDDVEDNSYTVMKHHGCVESNLFDDGAVTEQYPVKTEPCDQVESCDDQVKFESSTSTVDITETFQYETFSTDCPDQMKVDPFETDECRETESHDLGSKRVCIRTERFVEEVADNIKYELNSSGTGSNVFSEGPPNVYVFPQATATMDSVHLKQEWQGLAGLDDASSEDSVGSSNLHSNYSAAPPPGQLPIHVVDPLHGDGMKMEEEEDEDAGLSVTGVVSNLHAQQTATQLSSESLDAGQAVGQSTGDDDSDVCGSGLDDDGSDIEIQGEIMHDSDDGDFDIGTGAADDDAKTQDSKADDDADDGEPWDVSDVDSDDDDVSDPDYQSEMSVSSSDPDDDVAAGRARSWGRGRARGCGRGANVPAQDANVPAQDANAPAHGRGGGRGRGRAGQQGGGDIDPPRNWTNQIPNPVVHPFTSPCGPQCDIPFDGPKLDFLILVLGDRFFEMLCEQTNLYAVKVYPPDNPDINDPLRTSHVSWKPVVVEEMKAFIAINILMGLNQLPHYKDYWCKDSAMRNEWVSGRMSKNRYEILCKFLHCSDPNVVNPNDKLHKVRSVIEAAKENFPKAFKPHEHLSLDEAMIKYNGRLVWKRYMADKSAKWGVKVWCLSDPDTGYCLTFDVHTGAAGDNDDDIKRYGLGYMVVMRLMRDYLLCYHKLYGDSFFSSVNLLEDLHLADTYYTGTIRQDEKDFPTEISQPKLQYTEKICWKKEASPAVVCRFRDKNCDVYLISSCHGSEDVNTPPTKFKPYETISVPSSVIDYNAHIMGGVDDLDQLRSCYVRRTGSKWWKYVFWGILNIAIINAYIIWCQVNRPLPAVNQFTLKAFKLGLVHEMGDGFTSRKGAPHRPLSSKVALELIQKDAVPGHDKVRFKGRKKICENCKRNERRTLSGRRIETSYGCDKCKVSLCKGGDCFLAFHGVLI